MANKTISGCVDRFTGEITFIGEACDEGDYTGCIERTGVHAGQVAVTIDEENCDDTYYGCVNRATGEFDVPIPDDCCPEPGLCSDCSVYPDWDSGYTYSVGQLVTFASTVCFVSLQDANTNNSPDTSPEWWSRVACLSCPKGHVEGTPACTGQEGFGDGAVPKYLCARLIHIKRCSDDSTIPTAHCCLMYDGNYDWLHKWYGPCIFDGVLVTVFYQVWVSIGTTSDGYVETAESLWYFEASGQDGCDVLSNNLIPDSCPNDYVVGYDGYMEVCNPNTGDWWNV